MRSLLTCAGMCREQLKRSHSLRLQGQKALDELKSEFEAITKDLAAGDAVASLSATSALTHGAHDLRNYINNTLVLGISGNMH